MVEGTKTNEGYFKIKDYHLDDRPREKLVNQGKGTLSKAELLGLIIGSGIRQMNAVDLARRILSRHNNNLADIAKLAVEELTQFKGIGKAKATLIVSAMELGNRLQGDLHDEQKIVTTAENAYDLMKVKLRHKLTEEFWVILLNSRNQVINTIQISKGGLSRTIVDNKIVFKACLLHNAVAVILMHNHPSGSIQPSKADILLTKNILKASKNIGINVLDHIIFTNTKLFSFADEGMMNCLLDD